MTAIPLLIGVVILVSYFGNKASQDRIEEIANELKNTVVIDESNLINQEIVTQAGLTVAPADQLDESKELVRNGERDVLLVYPENLLSERTFQVYQSNMDLSVNAAAIDLGKNVLRTSLFLPLGSPEVIALAQNGADYEVTMYRDGAETAGFNEFIAPGIFLVLFYIIFAFSVSYMLTSVSEEKENRSMEMVLTYVKPRTLIVGKLLAVTFVTLTQVAFFFVLALTSYLIFSQTSSSDVALPLNINLADLPFHFWPIFFGASYLVVGFLLFAGFMTTAAAAAPSAKEANNFSAVFFIGAFIPFYFFVLLVTNPTNPLVQFLTYFPLTSPVVDLIRNTVGNMSFAESWLALGVMILAMLASIWIAVRAFKLGALEFGSAIKFSKLFKK